MVVTLGVVAILLLIQLVPGRVTNPPVKAEPPWDSARTRQLAVAACYNCHSNESKSYWYEHVAPISWWIKGHVTEGRDSFNFSEYDPNRHRSGTSIARTVSGGSMPPGYYTWLWRHPEAKLSAAEKQELIDGLVKTYGAATGRGGASGG